MNSFLCLRLSLNLLKKQDDLDKILKLQLFSHQNLLNIEKRPFSQRVGQTKLLIVISLSCNILPDQMFLPIFNNFKSLNMGN